MADVTVVGSFMMDLVLRAARRPAAGETVIGSSFQTFLGGKGFNQAIAAARSGATTAMIGALGGDDFGKQFRACLASEGIDDSAVLTANGTGTGVGVPLVEDNGENSIVVVPRANHDLTPEDVRAAKAVLENSRVVLLQLELPTPVVKEAAQIAHDAGATVVLNPAPAVAELAEFAGLVDYVVPNTSEASQLTGVDCNGEGAANAAAAVLQQTGASGVVLTLGSRGALVAYNGTVELVNGHTVTAVDTVGAGDAFCGALAAKLAAGASLEDAVAYGNAAGALAVLTAGAEPSMPRGDAVDRMLRNGS
jgi:ribokinase